MNDVDSILRSFPDAKRDSLIPILQAVQESQGFLSREAVVRISRHLKMPASKIYGVATFYNQFRFQAKGRYHIMLCRGTACHVKGSAKLQEIICKQLKIQPGQTTRDGFFSLEVVACIGACGLAPVISINGEFYSSMTPDKVSALLDNFKQKATSHEGN